MLQIVKALQAMILINFIVPVACPVLDHIRGALQQHADLIRGTAEHKHGTADIWVWKSLATFERSQLQSGIYPTSRKSSWKILPTTAIPVPRKLWARWSSTHALRKSKRPLGLGAALQPGIDLATAYIESQGGQMTQVKAPRSELEKEMSRLLNDFTGEGKGKGNRGRGRGGTGSRANEFLD